MSYIKSNDTYSINEALEQLWDAIHTPASISTKKPETVKEGSMWVDDTGRINVYRKGAWETYTKD